MKTLDEVIKVFTKCFDNTYNIVPLECEPEYGEDALHYLNEYRKHLMQDLDELRQKKYELEVNMKFDALLQEKPWEKRK